MILPAKYYFRCEKNPRLKTEESRMEGVAAVIDGGWEGQLDYVKDQYLASK